MIYLVVSTEKNVQIRSPNPKNQQNSRDVTSYDVITILLLITITITKIKIVTNFRN